MNKKKTHKEIEFQTDQQTRKGNRKFEIFRCVSLSSSLPRMCTLNPSIPSLFDRPRLIILLQNILKSFFPSLTFWVDLPSNIVVPSFFFPPSSTVQEEHCPSFRSVHLPRPSSKGVKSECPRMHVESGSAMPKELKELPFSFSSAALKYTRRRRRRERRRTARRRESPSLQL